jgi:hypothetical protein
MAHQEVVRVTELPTICDTGNLRIIDLRSTPKPPAGEIRVWKATHELHQCES